jgi:signal transduction histidine kinase
VSDRTTRRLAWGVFIGLSVVYAVGVGGSIATRSVDLFGVSTYAFPVVGILILARQPRNRIGWILLAIGAIWAAGGIMTSYAAYGLRAHPGSLPGADVADSLSQPLWAPAIGVMGVYLLLLFPDGRLPSRSWRPVAWLGGIGIVGAWVLVTIAPGPLDNGVIPKEANALGVEALKGFQPLMFLFIAMIPVATVASAVSLVRRFRSSTGTLRLQLKWLTSAAAAVAILYALAIAVSIPSIWGRGAAVWITVIQTTAVMSFVLIPTSIGFAVLRYRLYDIDVVINKTLVYGSMAAFISAVYVAIVVGIGHAVRSDRNLGLSILATALVAVAFQPVRERVQHFANRLVYGTRATPYQVLSEFSGGMTNAVATDELLPRMARMMAEGVGAAEVDVWLRLGSEMILEASWPSPNGASPAKGPTVRGEEVTIEGADAAIPVRHQGELLGVLGVRKPAGESLTPADSRLLHDLASQAGLVLRNVRLIEELKTSRQRLVNAQDQERRRLERDLHDGAQQRIVAIALAVRMARSIVPLHAPPDLGVRLDQASEQIGLALSELREFARGIHPAILTERGLVPAIGSLAERSSVPATLQSELDGRLPAPIEATAYFVVSEALANCAKYSRATTAVIRVERRDHLLMMEIADDGVGGADPSRGSGLRGLADRVAVVEGTLEIDSPPGKGTRVMVRIPLPVVTEATR